MGLVATGKRPERSIEMSSAELVIQDEHPEERGPMTLFGTADPRATLERMAECAAALVDVVKQRRLSVRIQGRDHLTVEAWTTLGAMVGVYAVIDWTKTNETGDGYVARAVARTLHGQVVGAAECECSRTERHWSARDAYALRSMAQTRAVSRALRAPLGQIVVLAGYEATGEEEMPRPESTSRPGVVSA
jgi:hypothetical protein